MGFKKAAMDRFRSRVDSTLEEMFPATLRIGGMTILASSPGGKAVSEYMEGGESTTYRFPFRLLATSVPTKPTVGTPIDWIIDETTTLTLEVIECSKRPHEDRFAMVCQKRRV